MIYKSKGIQFVTVIVLAIFNLAFSPSAYTNNKKGNELFQNEQYKEAEKYYREAQINDPQSESVRYNLGNVLYKNGEYQKAATEYELAVVSTDKALKKDSLYNLGNSRFQIAAENRSRENTEGAIESLKGSIDSFEKALAMDKEDEDVVSNLTLAKKVLKEIQLEQEKKEQQKDENKDENQEKNEEKKEEEKKKGENSEKKENDKSDKNEQGEKKDKEPQEEKDKKKGDEFKENEKKEEPKKEKSEEEEKAALSKEEAERLLDSLKNQESKLQKARRMNEQNGKSRGVERDW